MIAAWMLAATAFTLLLGVAALAIERVLRHTRYATRLPWTIALVMGLVWPLLAPLVLQTAAAPMPAAVVVAGEATTATAAMLSSRVPALPSVWNARLTPVLLAVWAVATALLLLRILLAARVLRRLGDSARPTVLDGHAVLVTDALGPAVIGLARPQVAVPAWFTELDRPLRALVLRHEHEHCRSRDPWLVWLSSVAVALVPWNVALWWLAGRLRLALEIDCDTRTLEQESTPAQYGKLLLLIAQRQSGYPLATMLAESTSHLSRRISAMQTTPLRRPLVRGVLLGSVAIGAIALACSPRIATDLTSPQSTARPAMTKTLSNGPVYFEYQVEKPVRSAKGNRGPKYPAALKAANVEGQVLAQFVVDEQGRAEPVTFKVLKSSDTAFTIAVREALDSMRFEPAMIGNKVVKQLVQQPFAFGSKVLQLPTNVIKANGPTMTAAPAAKQPGALPPEAVQAAEQSRLRAQAQGKPYFEFQVSKPVTQVNGSSAPVYPAELKAQKVEGEVLAMFVVGRDGMAEPSTYKVVSTTRPEFAAAVKDALATMKFEPALVDGIPVKQLLQQRFVFSLSK